MANAFNRYLLRTRRYSRLRFIVEMALVPFPFKIAIGMVLVPLMGESFNSTTDVIAKDGIGVLIISALLVAPLIETLIGQWLPIWLISRVTGNFAWVLFGSAFLFTLQHLHVGIAGMLPVFPVAVALSWSFLANRPISRWRAYWITSMIHCSHNAVSLIFYLFAS